MTAKELTLWQMEHVGKQVEKAVDGLSDAGWDHKPSPGAMCPREIIEHLCECVVAFDKSTKGEKHDWGNFSIDDKSPANLLSELRRLRSAALASVTDSDEILREAFLFGSAHDAYHVGQLCAARLDLDPNWNPYSIYEEA